MIDTGKPDTRFFIVWDATEGRAIDEFYFLEDAREKAEAEAEARLGNTIIIFQPAAAYRSSARTTEIFLEYPVRNLRAAEPEKPAAIEDEAAPIKLKPPALTVDEALARDRSATIPQAVDFEDRSSE